MRWPKILSLLLLLILLTQAIVVLVFMQLRLTAIHTKNWITTDTKDLVSVSLTLKEFERSKVNAHELRINGKMYDIKGKKRTATGYDFVLKYDKEEQSVLDNIAGFFTGNNSQPSQSNGAQVPALFALHFYEKNLVFRFGFNAQIILLGYANNKTFSIVWPDTDTPPPKTLFFA